MNRLNLLPPEIKEELIFAKKNAKIIKFLAYSLSTLIIIFAFFFGLGLFIKYQQDGYETVKSAAEDNLKQDDTLTKKVRDISDRLKVIKKLEASRTDWGKIYSTLSTSTPVTVQLTSISIDNEKKTRAQINGIAASDKDVVLFRDLLAKTTVFKYIDVESISDTTDPTGKNIYNKMFVISLTVNEVKS